jgi:hypothetical protein
MSNDELSELDAQVVGLVGGVAIALMGILTIQVLRGNSLARWVLLIHYGCIPLFSPFPEESVCLLV